MYCYVTLLDLTKHHPPLHDLMNTRTVAHGASSLNLYYGPMIRVSNEMDLCMPRTYRRVPIVPEHNTLLRKLIQWVRSGVNTDRVGLTSSDTNGHTR